MTAASPVADTRSTMRTCGKMPSQAPPAQTPEKAATAAGTSFPGGSILTSGGNATDAHDTCAQQRPYRLPNSITIQVHTRRLLTVSVNLRSASRMMRSGKSLATFRKAGRASKRSRYRTGLAVIVYHYSSYERLV